MNAFIAHCGLDCETCDARLATARDDDSLRAAVAKRWSELNGVAITPDMINCDGCRIDGRKTPYCASLCPIRQCALAKHLQTCGDCPEMASCSKLAPITSTNPAALRRLASPETQPG